MKNCDKFNIETFGVIESDKQLKELQADIRRLPNFGGKGICCDNVTTRDFFAILRDKKTGEIWSYFGSRASFNEWGQEPAITASEAAQQLVSATCWCCGANPINGRAKELKMVKKAGEIKVWECETCYASGDSKQNEPKNTPEILLH